VELALWQLPLLLNGDTLSITLTPLTEPDVTSSSHRLTWLASDTDANPVGSAQLRLFTKPGHAHLAELELTVHPAERRKGVGSQLLDAAVRVARDREVRTVITDATVVPDHGGLLTDTADNNQPMRRINDTLGYRPTHQTHRYQLDLRIHG
jgi:GNAT superfamily N-acetyltransferase